jgi:hypothetical protein
MKPLSQNLLPRRRGCQRDRPGSVYFNAARDRWVFAGGNAFLIAVVSPPAFDRKTPSRIAESVTHGFASTRPWQKGGEKHRLRGRVRGHCSSAANMTPSIAGPPVNDRHQLTCRARPSQ